MKHAHADAMMQYAQDAMETDRPWERWEYTYRGDWSELSDAGPRWDTLAKYRRKPKPYEPTLLDQALELEIEAAKIKCKHYNDPRDTNSYLWCVAQYDGLAKTRSPAMIEHLKSQGKL
jgi:hypothetical protein